MTRPKVKKTPRQLCPHISRLDKGKKNCHFWHWFSFSETSLSARCCFFFFSYPKPKPHHHHHLLLIWFPTRTTIFKRWRLVIEEERFEVEEASEVWDLAPERVSFEFENSEEGKRKLRKKVSNDVGTIGTKMCIYDHFFLFWTDVSALK